MFKKFLAAIISFVALFSLNGCLVLPQDSSGNGTYTEDMFSGLDRKSTRLNSSHL